MNFFILLLIGLLLFEGAHLILLKLQVNRYKTYWQKQAAAVTSKDALWYVALGDSATQGIGASQPSKGYVGLIGESLHQKTGRLIHVVNLSVTGAKVEDAFNTQLPKLQALSLPQDSIVSLEIGANDMASFEPERFEQQMDLLLRAVPNSTIVSDVPYFGGGVFRSREHSVIKANEIIHKLVINHYLKLVPLHETTMKNSSWLNNAADLFHPSNRGYKNWYEAFSQALGL